MRTFYLGMGYNWFVPKLTPPDPFVTLLIHHFGFINFPSAG